MGSMKAALDMEMMKSNGNYVFNNNKCLTQGQIKGCFSRLAVKQRSMQQVFDQQSTPSTSLSSPSIIGTFNMDNPNPSSTIVLDESNESDEID